MANEKITEGSEQHIIKQRFISFKGIALLLLAVILFVLAIFNLLQLDSVFRFSILFVGAICLWAGLEYLFDAGQLIVTEEGLTKYRRDKVVMKCLYKDISNTYLDFSMGLGRIVYRLYLQCGDKEILISLGSSSKSDIKLLLQAIVDHVGVQVDVKWLTDYLLKNK